MSWERALAGARSAGEVASGPRDRAQRGSGWHGARRLVIARVGSCVMGADGPAVSSLALGTMLFGEMTSFGEACDLMSVAFDSGVSLFDTAEMYPVPQRAETSGRSEEFVGRWMKARRREEITIATKIAGPSGQMSWIRGGPVALDAANIKLAVEGSLRRLGTDYIDLMQLHWPDRYVPMFGDVDFDPARCFKAVPIQEQLGALAVAMKEGKVRHVGLSNETPWGLMQFCRLAEQVPGLPRVVSIQNSYSLLCRTFDSGLAECCHSERVSLLAYSPLAMGLLTGKYLAPDGGPPMARLNRYRGRYAEAESRYGLTKPNVREAVGEYTRLAAAWGISALELAIRFVFHHPLVASTIVGASSVEQLRSLLHAADRPPLEVALVEEIDSIHRRFPNPTP